MGNMEIDRSWIWELLIEREARDQISVLGSGLVLDFLGGLDIYDGGWMDWCFSLVWFGQMS